MLILRIEDLKNVSQTILTAVDSNELSIITETLELKVENNILYMNVTNREYYAQVKLNMNNEDEFHATVNANLFLKLVSQITTDTVEFSISGNSLVIKANGTYRLPLIYDNDRLLELPIININNITSEFDIDGDILVSILQYNSKQLTIGTISKPVQKMYYVDDRGALTFTSGACVNSFNLEKPVKMLLNNRLVKLFKLFKGSKVHFTIGYDAISDDIIQTKVRFESDNVLITAVLFCDDAMINSVPVNAIRGRAQADYPYSVNFNKDALLQMINRLVLFTTSSSKELTAYCMFEFNDKEVIVSDMEKENKEIIKYNNDTTNIEEPYTAILDLNDLKGTLDSCIEEYVTFKFGDEQAVLICRGNVVNVIPELHIT